MLGTEAHNPKIVIIKGEYKSHLLFVGIKININKNPIVNPNAKCITVPVIA